MASSVIHLAVAKEYLKNNPYLQLNTKDVLAGALYPDTVSNKDESHYTDKNRGQDNISHLKGKVNLYDFLQDHDIDSSFALGWFIHLLTDYLFFSECFSETYLLKTSYEDFCHDLYFSYDCLNNYLSKKYNVLKEDYEAYPAEYYEGTVYQECLFTKKQIDTFINRVATIDLEEYIKKINEAKQNVKP